MKYSHDVIVIGAGSAGLTAAGGCAMLGLRTALIERGEMGGDCLNTGCVPSKALIAAAHRAHAMRTSSAYGIAPAEPAVDFAAVHAHVHGAIAAIAPEDSQERFEEMGVEVIRTAAKLVDGRTVEVGDEGNGRCLTAPRIVLATGSRARIPDMDGLDSIDYLTNENLWKINELPRRLLILGGGPIGMEMAQAFRRLGSQVAIATNHRPMGKDDPDAAQLVITALREEGVEVIEDVHGRSVRKTGDSVALLLDDGKEITGSHLLLATGREVDFTGLGLEKAGVKWDSSGIEVDARRRTTNKRIYAIGDCRQGPRFTHASGYEGSNVVLEIAFGLPAKADYRALPWVTYTDPELAQVGMTENEARKKHGDAITVWREDFAHNDRAIAEGETKGFIKIIKKGGKVLGATIVGAHAGDLLLPWSMAIAGKKSTFGIASLIVPYPNRAEHSKAAAFASEEKKIFNKWSRGWASFVSSARR